MKLKGEKELKADELYSLLSNEVVMSFASYVETIKASTYEELNSRDDLIELIEEKQPTKYCTFIGLLNADLDLKTIKVLIDIERNNQNLIESIANRLNAVKDRINIFNENEMQQFILDSVYLLATYYDSGETDVDDKKSE